MRSILLHQIKDAVHMQNSAYMDRSVPPYINARIVPRCTDNINNRFDSAQYLRRINDLNLGKRCSILPTVKHIFQQHKNRLGVRVYVLSDLHTDYPANMAWVQRLSTTTYKRDILIVAGDVAEKFENFVLTMFFLKERFRYVFFVPGNHDVWCRSKQEPYVDSVEKLDALMQACSDLGVATEPKLIDGVGIIPLFSWYHQSFDKERDITDLRILSLEMACKDFHACKWPSTLSSSDLSLARYFDEMNFKHFEMIREIQETSCQVITFSHFLPRPELCPEKRMLFYPNLRAYLHYRRRSRSIFLFLLTKMSDQYNYSKDSASDAAERTKQYGQEKTGQAQGVTQTAQQKAAEAARATREKASQATEMTKEKASQAAETTKGVGQSAAEKASQTTQAAKEKAQQGKEGTGSILQQGKEGTGSILQQAGEKVKGVTQSALETLKHPLGGSDQGDQGDLGRDRNQ